MQNQAFWEDYGYVERGKLRKEVLKHLDKPKTPKQLSKELKIHLAEDIQNPAEPSAPRNAQFLLQLAIPHEIQNHPLAIFRDFFRVLDRVLDRFELAFVVLNVKVVFYPRP